MFDICISGTFYKHEIVYINQSEGERVWGEGGGGGGAFFNTINESE